MASPQLGAVRGATTRGAGRWAPGGRRSSRPELLLPSAPGRAHTAEPGAPGGRSFRRTRLPAASCPARRTASCSVPGRRWVPQPPEAPRCATRTMQSRLLLLGVPGGLGDVASRRVRLLLRQVVRGRPGGDRQRLEVRLMHTGATDSGNQLGPPPSLPPLPPLAAAA